MALPLDKRSKIWKAPLSDAEENLLALHPKWVSEVSFLCYEAPPQCRGDSSQAATDEWLERTEFIREDVAWLLNQTHQLFWCQVIFDKSLHKLLDTFLASAPRPSDLIELRKPVADAQSALHQSMFKVLLRMATHKESSDDFFTPSVFGQIVYENYLFDIPKLIDLCALYGDEACFSVEEAGSISRVGKLLQRMVCNVFEQQPAYSDDLSASAHSLIMAADNIIQTLQGRARGTQLLDVLLYCYDLVQSLALFCSVHRAANQILVGAGLMDRLLTLAPLLNKALSTLSLDTDVPRKLALVLCRRLPLVCSRLLWELLFKSDLAAPSGKVILSTFNSLSANWPEMLARLDSCGYGVNHQLSDMNILGPSDLRSVVDKVQDVCKSFPLHVPYLPDGVSSESACASSYSDSPASASAEASSACANPLEVSCQQVLELLPDFDKDLIRIALEQTDGNIERAVNMLLEGKVSNPPPPTSGGDVQQPRNRAKRNPAPAKATRGAEYTKFVLDGSGHDEAVAAVRATLDALETAEFEETIAGANEYDDEYDDTYDSHVLGELPGGGDGDRDEFVIRRLNQKKPLFRAAISSSESGSEDENADEERAGGNGQQQGSSGGSRSGAGRAGPRHDNGDSAAGTGGGEGSRGRGRGGQRGGRGRGVPPEQRRTFQNKEQHKSSRANHSRKSGADWKRRGMGGISSAPPPR